MEETVLAVIPLHPVSPELEPEPGKSAAGAQQIGFVQVDPAGGVILDDSRELIADPDELRGILGVQLLNAPLPERARVPGNEREGLVGLLEGDLLGLTPQPC